MCSDDVVNRAKLDHHLLVMRVALGGTASPNTLFHHNIDFQALSFIVSELKQISVLHEKVDIPFLLNFVPIIVNFR